MTALLYRGHSYEAPADSPKACVELTYRREHYNTCREKVTHNTHPRLTYRGAPTPSDQGLIKPQTSAFGGGFFLPMGSSEPAKRIGLRS